MQVKIDDARQMFGDLCDLVTSDKSTAEWLVELFLDNDLTGNRFSGFDEVIALAKKGRIDIEKYSVVVNKPALKLIDCHETPSYILMKDILPVAEAWAHEQGQVFIGFKGGGYHENLGTFARMFAEKNLLCIYSSNGGPQGVVPFGGSKDIMGTNPMAYGIPTNSLPIVFDAATAQYAYGAIKQAKAKGESLPAGTYLDKEGKYTTDPNTATALIPFGGYKGYAINLLLEVMTGALVGGKSGLLQTEENQLGGFMLLIDPAQIGAGLEAFKAQTDQLVRDIESNPPAEGFSEVRVPGHRAHRLSEKQKAEGLIEVDDKVYAEFLSEYKRLTQSN